eukprot:2613743-Pyramimonas_sp.AAC.1
MSTPFVVTPLCCRRARAPLADYASRCRARPCAGARRAPGGRQATGSLCRRGNRTVCHLCHRP